jgi:CheY-like chemotaxis protein
MLLAANRKPRRRRAKGTVTGILLADDQPVVRQAPRCLLERESDLQVEASDGLDVVPLVEQLKSDVLVTDVAMRVSPAWR